MDWRPLSRKWHTCGRCRGRIQHHHRAGKLDSTIEATKRVKALNIPTVWGGVHATIMPADVLREAYVDFVIVNEGEQTAQEFTHALQNGQAWETIRGLAWKNGDGHVVTNPERPFIREPQRLRARWDLVADIPAYFLQSGPYDKAIPVYISRGCPFRCGFCYNEVVMKRTWRQHSDEFIVRQINWLRDTYGVNAVDYADDYLFGRHQTDAAPDEKSTHALESARYTCGYFEARIRAVDAADWLSMGQHRRRERQSGGARLDQ